MVEFDQTTDMTFLSILNGAHDAEKSAVVTLSKAICDLFETRKGEGGRADIKVRMLRTVRADAAGSLQSDKQALIIDVVQPLTTPDDRWANEGDMIQFIQYRHRRMEQF